MTIVVPHDYPDWGRQVSQSDIVAYREIGTSISADTTLPLRFVGSSPWLAIEFSASTSRGRALFEWFIDDAAATRVAADGVNIKVNAPATVALPIQAPFVRVLIRLSAYPGTFSLKATMTPVAVTQWSEERGNVMSRDLNLSVGAVSTVTSIALLVRMGAATVSVQAKNATLFDVEMYAVRFNSTRAILDAWVAAGTPPARNIFVPPLPIEFDFINGDGVARTVNSFLSHNIPGP